MFPFTVRKNKIGNIYTETTCDQTCDSFITTTLKDQYGKELGKEVLSINPGTSYGMSIEVSPKYRNKGYGLGEILRLSSIMMILENKVNEFLIFSLPSAIFFHSKYKFIPSIENSEECQNALKAMIKNCDKKYYGDLKFEAQALFTKMQENDSFEENKTIYDLTNKLLEKYITRIITFGNDYKSHPFKFGMSMKLTLENILDNKDFFNKLFQKHKIDYHI
jgi:hypothetical protein